MNWLATDGKGLGYLTDDEQLEHDCIQPVEHSNGRCYGLARVHNTMLISSRTPFAVDQRPIEGDTNEIGALPQLIEELLEVYGHTSLFEGLITDAGNCSQAVGRRLNEACRAYALRITETQGDIYKEARRCLASSGVNQAEVVQRRTVRSPQGEQLREEWRLYRHHLGDAGYLAWDHARQLIRIEHLKFNEQGEVVHRGERYWVSNVPLNTMDGAEWLLLTRRYWNIENNLHGVADRFFKEDARRTPWTKSAEALYAIAVLRAMVISILTLLRARVRLAASHEAPSWKMIFRQIWAMLCPGSLPRRMIALS